MIELEVGLILAILYEYSCLTGKKGSIIVCIISPLTAIMMEQQAKFEGMGISAEYVGERQKDPTTWRRVLNVHKP